MSSETSFSKRSAAATTRAAFSTQPSLAETEVSIDASQRTYDLYPLSHHDKIEDDHDVRVLHVIRHAEGTHNVKKEYRDLRNLDARLTPKGVQQCKERSKVEQALKNPQLVVTSSMTRCVQTALLSFPTLAINDEVPFVAHDSVRETVNYACDRRRPLSEIAQEFPRVDFSLVQEEYDDIWNAYEERLGSSHDKHRESGELHKVAERGRQFFSWLERETDASEVILCSHAAFLRCIFGWGQPGGVLHAPPQILDSRQESTNVPLFRYCGNEDGEFEATMRTDYANCEMRSFLVAFPKK